MKKVIKKMKSFFVIIYTLVLAFAIVSHKYLLIVIGLLIAWFALDRYDSIPVVYWSYSNDECVRMLLQGEDIGCDCLPDRYEIIWVE